MEGREIEKGRLREEGEDRVFGVFAWLFHVCVLVWIEVSL